LQRVERAMIDTILELVPTYGHYIVVLSTFLSCIAVPIPSSLIMLTAGAFVASGDLSGFGVAGLALGGAVVGDQVGYAIGRSATGVLDRLRGKAAVMVGKARNLTQKHGGIAVFSSRWLFSPLGPYMNLVTGAAQMSWFRFTVWGVAGEIVWVTVYLGAGYVFASQIEAIADIGSNISGALAAGIVTIILGQWLRTVIKADRRVK
jgi:membrane-associated protein